VKTRPLRLALCGNPNCGKSELFNALTGSSQRVGNWPGVTVDKKVGLYQRQQQSFEVTDLPGIYSLEQCAENQSIDSTIACQFLFGETPDILINVIDASQLKRHLFLTAQLSERQIPTILAVNMMDVAEKKGLSINLKALSKKLGCPVVGLVAKRKIGIESLREAVSDLTENLQPPKKICHWPQPKKEVDNDLLSANVYYEAANSLYQKTVSQQQEKRQLTSHWLDRIVLNRYAGIPIFLFVMYLMFVFAINVGGAFQDFFDISSHTLFVSGTAHLLQWLHAPHWASAILSDGLGKGINTVASFIPVIAAMFLFLALLEDSGYLSRAAFVMDRLMQKLGLPGQSFIPLIVGFGCNVPAVLGARTLSTPRDRILTILMTPFISCGARLAIFAVFASAFFPHGGQNIIFLLYLTGIIAAIGTGFILRKTVLSGKATPLIMELPEYHLPSLRSMRKLVWQRLKGFLWRAGRYIIPVCLIIGALNSMYIHGPSNSQKPVSLLSAASQSITPVLAPMGIHADNWPATVGLVTGVLAKEVVIGTLNTLYSHGEESGTYSLTGGLTQAALSVPANLSNLNHAFSNPFLAAESSHDMSAGAMQTMVARFASPLAAFSYLVFILLYFPCISTLAAMCREIPRSWAVFSMLWTTGLAYAVAVSVYQLGTMGAHPVTTTCWVSGFVTTFYLAILALKHARQYGFFTMPTALTPTNSSRCNGCNEGCTPQAEKA
jgi:ferrous iron transport protein B